MNNFDLKAYIRDIPDFPKKGIVYKDITPLLASKEAFEMTIQGLVNVGKESKIQKVVAIESRGFIFGSAVGFVLGVGVIPARKKGKLPYKTIEESYQLEYGEDSLEIHEDALSLGERVLVVDDVLATGGTASAVIRLVKKAGGIPVAASFVLELGFLKGREKLPSGATHSLIQY